MTEQELRRKICDIGKRMYEQGMASSNDGNISVRLNAGFLCTPTGVSKGELSEDMLSLLDENGQHIDGMEPSSEIKMHLRVYEKRTDVNAVVHAHPPYATTFAIANEPLDRPIMAEAVVALGKVPVAPYGTPSTKEIPDNIEIYLTEYNAMLLANHGALSYGKDLTEAYMRMENVEFYARMMYQAETLGRARELDKKELERLEEVINSRK